MLIFSFTYCPNEWKIVKVHVKIIVVITVIIIVIIIVATILMVEI
jgi:hypothetical protein